MSKTAAITGAASGIGQAACRRLWGAVADSTASKGYRPSGVSPIDRIAEPDDVGDVVMFPRTDSARYVTGMTGPVDGGTQAAFIPPGSNR